MVERFFRDITNKRIRRDSFKSVPELKLAIDLCIAKHKADPKPFTWTASASDILAKVTQGQGSGDSGLTTSTQQGRATLGIEIFSLIASTRW